MRLTKDLKSKIDLFCDDSGIDRTFYITTLIRNNLKKAGYLKSVKDTIHIWQGNVEDMPIDIDNNSGGWKIINNS